MKRREDLALTALAGVSLLASPARAADEIVIGAIYPLTGNAAQVGADAKAAIDTMLEIVNGTHDPLPMLMGKGGGLDKLGGAKIRVVFADHQNDPQKARAEAERLITQEKVVALIGSYTSATAATISQVAERYEVPYLSMDNSSPQPEQARAQVVLPHQPARRDVHRGDVRLLQGGRRQDRATRSSPSRCSTRTASSAATAAPCSASWRRRRRSPSRPTSSIAPTRRRLSAEAQRLKAANADVIMPSSYTSDAILLLRSLAEIGYKPRRSWRRRPGSRSRRS